MGGVSEVPSVSDTGLVPSGVIVGLTIGIEPELRREEVNVGPVLLLNLENINVTEI